MHCKLHRNFPYKVTSLCPPSSGLLLSMAAVYSLLRGRPPLSTFSDMPTANANYRFTPTLTSCHWWCNTYDLRTKQQFSDTAFRSRGGVSGQELQAQLYIANASCQERLPMHSSVIMSLIMKLAVHGGFQIYFSGTVSKLSTWLYWS